MFVKPLIMSVAIGLAGLTLSGCVYDAGPYYGGYGPYYGGGYYAGTALIYRERVRPRYPRYYRDYRHHHRADDWPRRHYRVYRDPT
ncbi:hypothetical protein [Aquamicrobium sp. LC103]|uniref:hypothetical protein n=1 Tax=Aquamicrobium sp. LC103 TaxID=1120658 RepID=UPI00069A21F3|nr:hypothetical protein [Aquamicrobium sp. LC103]TKT74171.1 hypothetical protein XW59_024445 [Aquamicrobium sp. LC103]